MTYEEALRLVDPTHVVVTDGTPEAEADLVRARAEAMRLIGCRRCRPYPGDPCVCGWDT